MSPCLVVTNDTIELVRSFVLGAWLIAVGLASASGTMIFFIAEISMFRNRQYWSALNIAMS
jgi:hypothetical protein